MASRQRSISPHPLDHPSGVRAAAHNTRVYVLRLLLIAALTAVVVVVWSTQTPDSPAAVDSAPVATTLVTPAAEGRAAVQPPAFDSLVPAVAPQPNAIPRPPELAEPARPLDFVRFTVQRGDTIFDVSVVYGVPIDEILRYNPALGDGSRVDVGDLVYVPVFEE